MFSNQKLSIRLSSASSSGKSSSKKWSIKNWLVGSKGLSSLVSELLAAPSSSSLSSSNAQFVTNSVNRYRSLLTHSSSWELLSPQQILTCLGASSIPLYSQKNDSSSSRDDSEKTDQQIDDQQSSEKNKTTNAVSSSSSSPGLRDNNIRSHQEQEVSPSLLLEQDMSSHDDCNRVVEAKFAEAVWSAALPSLQSFSVTMTCAEAASVVRSAHRLSVALPPSLLALCAERFGGSSFLESTSTEKDAKFFETFIPPVSNNQSHQKSSTESNNSNSNEEENEDEEEERQVRSAVSLMVRTAHAFSAQSSLLFQQQQRHEKLASSRGMLKMIQNAVRDEAAEESNSEQHQSSTSPQKFADGGDNTNPVKRFSLFLYQPDQIELCMELCSESTISLLETCVGVSEDLLQSKDADQELISLLKERQNHLLSLFSYSSLCIAIESISLCGNCGFSSSDAVESVSLQSRKQNLCRLLTRELVRRVRLANNVSSSSSTVNKNKLMSHQNHEENNHNNNIINVTTVRNSYSLVKTICQIHQSHHHYSESENNTNNDEIISLANDFYVTLTHRLGSFVRRLSFAGPEFYEDFVNAAIEMEKAAHQISLLHHYQKKDSGNNNIENEFNATTTTVPTPPQQLEDPFSSSIFKGERHSLDGPLVVESVANYFDHILELHNTNSRYPLSSSSSSSSFSFSNFSSFFYSSLVQNRQSGGRTGRPGEKSKQQLLSSSKVGSAFSSSFLKNFKDVDQYTLLSSVAPLCIGSLVVWSDIRDVRIPAIMILSKSLRHLSPTHLVRVCQLVPRLRTNGYLGGAELELMMNSSSSDANKNKSKTDDENSENEENFLSPLSEKEYSHFIDELLAAIYVSYKDLSCVGCCVALRALAEVSVAEKELLSIHREETSSSTTGRSYENEKSTDEKTLGINPHVLPIGALSLCVQTLSSRISELLESDAYEGSSSSRNRNNKDESNNSIDSSANLAALHSDQRINDSNSPVVKKGYQAMVVLEHVGVSLSMLGMLPGISSSTTTSPSDDGETQQSSSIIVNEHQQQEQQRVKFPSRKRRPNTLPIKKSVEAVLSSNEKTYTFEDSIKLMKNGRLCFE